MAAYTAKQLRAYNVATIAIWLSGVETERAHVWMNSLPPEKRPD